jgi:hypothetical protein
MKTDHSPSKVKAPAGQALWQTIRQTGQRAADSQLPGPGRSTRQNLSEDYCAL